LSDITFKISFKEVVRTRTTRMHGKTQPDGCPGWIKTPVQISLFVEKLLVKDLSAIQYA